MENKEYYGMDSSAREKAEELIEKNQLKEIISGLDEDRTIRQAAVLRWLKTLEMFHDNTQGKGRPYTPLFEDENGICRIRAYKCFFLGDLDKVADRIKRKDVFHRKNSFTTPSDQVKWAKDYEDKLLRYTGVQAGVGCAGTSTTLDFGYMRSIDPLGETIVLAIDIPIDHIHVFPGGQGVTRVYKPGFMPFNEAELTLFGSPGVLVPFGEQSLLPLEDVVSNYSVFAANSKFNLDVLSLKEAYEKHYLKE